MKALIASIGERGLQNVYSLLEYLEGSLLFDNANTGGNQMKKSVFKVVLVFIIVLSANTMFAENPSTTAEGLEKLFEKLKSENVSEIGEAATEIGKIAKDKCDTNLWIKHKTIHNLIIALYKVEHRLLRDASQEEEKTKKEVEKQITEALRSITGNTEAVTSNQWDEYMEILGKSMKYVP